MTVALDATPLTEPTGGIARYTFELARALACEFPDDNYWLLSDQPFPAPASFPNLRCGSGPRHFLERRWWTWGLPRRISQLRIDVFHGTDFTVPYLPFRASVLTLHDLSPWRDQALHSGAKRIRARMPWLLRFGLAAMVITPSKAVREEAIQRFTLSPDRVVAIPEAASETFRPVPVSKRHVPFFLHVGTLEPRKNIPLIVDAWREVREQHQVDLILVGRKRDDFGELKAEPGLHWRNDVPDERLPDLYSAALAVVYPSLYEGFGLPVLEAMQCGAAVFTSRDPAISETAAGAAIQLDASDRRVWVEALTAAVRNPEWLAGLRVKSVERAAQFSWARTAASTREVYLEARRRFGR